MTEEEPNAEVILGNYKKMMSECQQIAAKITEVRSVIILMDTENFAADFSCDSNSSAIAHFIIL